MSFAKLSAALLACNDSPSIRALAQARSAPTPGAGGELPANESGFGQVAENPVDIAQLHDALRECIEANDQEGVSRVFGHLVRGQDDAISAIADLVEALSKAPPTDEVETSGLRLVDALEPDPSADFEQGSPEPADLEIAGGSFAEDAIAGISEAEDNDAAECEWSSLAADVDLGSDTPPPGERQPGWTVEPLLLPQTQEAGDITAPSDAVDDGIFDREQGAEPARCFRASNWRTRRGIGPRPATNRRHALLCGRSCSTPRLPRRRPRPGKCRRRGRQHASARRWWLPQHLSARVSFCCCRLRRKSGQRCGQATLGRSHRGPCRFAAPAPTGTTAEKTTSAAAPPTSISAISMTVTTPAIAKARPADLAPVATPERSDKHPSLVAVTPKGTVGAAPPVAADPPEKKNSGDMTPPTDAAGPAAPPSIASAVTAAVATDRPEAKTAIASLEPAKEAAAVAAPIAISPPPAPSVSAKREVEPVKEPPLSAGEAALLLERGDPAVRGRRYRFRAALLRTRRRCGRRPGRAAARRNLRPCLPAAGSAAPVGRSETGGVLVPPVSDRPTAPADPCGEGS